MCSIRCEDRISDDELKLNWITCRNVYEIEGYNGLVMKKDWRRVLGLVNVEPSMLVVVSPEGDLGKSGIK